MKRPSHPRRKDRWHRWRKYTVGTAVFLINTAVILGLASLLLITSIAAPALLHR